jgi:hypothetical protein
MEIIIEAIGGIFWITAYVLIIIKGFKEKTYGMPIAAFCFNFSWEFIFSVIYLPDLDLGLTKFLWLFLDIVILYQIIKFWKNEHQGIKPSIFYLAFIFMFFIAFSLVFLTRKEFGVTFGDFYIPYFINLLMSILFILMLYNRASLRGQSILIALFKLLGSATYSIWCYLFIDELNNSRLIILLYLSVFFIDLIYLMLIYFCKKGIIKLSMVQKNLPVSY